MQSRYTILILVWLTSLAPISSVFGMLNERSVISQVSVTPDARGRRYTLHFTLADKEEKKLKVSLRVFTSKGNEIKLLPANVVGDVGYPIATGGNKKIVVLLPKGIAFDPHAAFEIIVDDLDKVDVAEMLSQVDTMEIKKSLAMIYGERNLKSTAAEKHLHEVQNFMSVTFEKNGISCSRHEVRLPKVDVYKLWEQCGMYFDSLTWDNSPWVNVNNIVGNQSAGSNASIVVLGAHYDSYKGSPGLDDNGTGVAGLLEAMRILSKYQFNKTIRYVAFDMEEDGLVGSLAYVFKGGLAKQDKVDGVINFDMIGVSSEKPHSQEIPEGFEMLFPDVVKAVVANEYRGDFVINIVNQQSAFLNETFDKSRARFVSNLKSATLIAENNGRDVPPLAASDHASFWHGGIPAIHVGEGGGTRNGHIHSSEDAHESVKINYAFMSDILKATIASVAEVAEVNHATSVRIQL